MSEALSARRFIERLNARQSDVELAKIQRYFKSGAGEYGQGDAFMGVRMGDVFALAKEFIGLPASEISKLLDHKIHEVRAGGLSIMDKQARHKKTSPEQRKALYELCMRKLKRINNWDPKRLRTFLEQHAARMPRTMLRYAIEHLSEKGRKKYLAAGK